MSNISFLYMYPQDTYTPFRYRRLANLQNGGKFSIMEGLKGFGKFIQNIDCVQIIRCSIHPPTVLVYWIISIKFKDFHIFRLHFYYFSAPFFTYFSIHLIYKLKKWTHLIHSISIQINNLDSTYPYYGLILPSIPPQWILGRFLTKTYRRFCIVKHRNTSHFLFSTYL